MTPALVRRASPTVVPTLLRRLAARGRSVSAALVVSLLTASPILAQTKPPEFSGIYPHLAFFNEENECGTGAVVPWAGRLWAITYAPHKPEGSTDKLYEITPDLEQIVRPESVGGTPANRFIHRESQQLFIGPYVIGADRTVRVLTPQGMYGRHTGNARHLTDPANKIYYATMEEGLYEVDVKSLAVTELWADEQRKEGRHSNLPGYHGKGLYSGQGRIVYANNGDHAKEALSDPTVPSGVLAEWDGKADAWTSVRRNQFTEVTGPGGIYGNENPDTDPIWTIGWDHLSLILMVLEKGEWHSFRLPKASHSYDGAHGWNTEWPRIRDIGPEGKPDLLMTMHGTFWRFPNTFSASNSAGIAPRSTYLKVVGDFTRWGDRIVLGCDDTAKAEFLNKRKAKGSIEGPGQSQSNLWFVAPERLDQLGALHGRGAVWLGEPVKAGQTSDPFLFSGYERRGLHLSHETDMEVGITLEVNDGTGEWRKLRDVRLMPGWYTWVEFTPEEKGAWIRLVANNNITEVTALFQYSSADRRGTSPAPIFAGIAAATARDYVGGVVRARGANKRTLAFAAMTVRDGQLAEEGYYELDGAMQLKRVQDPAAHEYTKKAAAIPQDVISADAASVLVVDDKGARWRLPRGTEAYDEEAAIPLRVDREVCTERDLFNADGTFYELPAENAGGFSKMRPISTHGRRIVDYCSYRGLLILTGIALDQGKENRHIIRSDDGKVALWAGVVDDLWQFGKARGQGGPWMDSAVKRDEPSDPYLMSGYDRKHLTLSHKSAEPVKITVEVDITGSGFWKPYRTFKVEPGQSLEHTFPLGYEGYWLRTITDRDCEATAWLKYE